MNEYMNTKKVSGEEVDALGSMHKHLSWKVGERKRIKKKYNKRNRKKVKGVLRDEY